MNITNYKLSPNIVLLFVIQLFTATLSASLQQTSVDLPMTYPEAEFNPMFDQYGLNTDELMNSPEELELSIMQLEKQNLVQVLYYKITDILMDLKAIPKENLVKSTFEEIEDLLSQHMESQHMM